MLHPSLKHLPNVWKETYDIVAQVPPGRVTTYGEVARALGDPIAARFVGLAMSRNVDIDRVPCRRVVRSDGSLGGYSGPGGVEEKASLLRREGVRVRNGRVEGLSKLLFKDFKSSEPLKTMRMTQDSLRRRVRIPEDDASFDAIAGVDVSYDDDRGFASMVVLDADTRKIRDKVVVEADAGFPYIPTFLAFRELPIISSLMHSIDGDVPVMLDGHGVLHPSRFGLASHAGVVFNRPTIGVAKRLLCGTATGRVQDGVRRVVVSDSLRGYELSVRGKRPVYISPGHCISHTQALAVTRDFTVHRVPEPTRLAHASANAARRLASNK